VRLVLINSRVKREFGLFSRFSAVVGPDWSAHVSAVFFVRCLSLNKEYLRTRVTLYHRPVGYIITVSNTVDEDSIADSGVRVQL